MTPTYSTLLSTLRELVEASKNPDAQPMRLARAIYAAESVLSQRDEVKVVDESLWISPERFRVLRGGDRYHDYVGVHDQKYDRHAGQAFPVGTSDVEKENWIAAVIAKATE